MIKNRIGQGQTIENYEKFPELCMQEVYRNLIQEWCGERTRDKSLM
jgi:hypothetical protein